MGDELINSAQTLCKEHLPLCVLCFLIIEVYFDILGK